MLGNELADRHQLAWATTHFRAKRLNLVSSLNESFHMVVQGPARSAGRQVVPNRNPHLEVTVSFQGANSGRWYSVAVKVGIDVRSLQFAGASRGTGLYIVNLLRALAGSGTNTEFVLLVNGSLPIPTSIANLGPSFKIARIAGPASADSEYPWYLAHPRLRSSLPFLPGRHWRKFIEQHATAFCKAVVSEAVDVVHFTAPFDPFLTPVVLTRIKTVYTFLDAIPYRYREEMYDQWDIDAKKLYELQAMALRTADRVVALSDASRRDSIEFYGVSEQRAATIYCAVEPPKKGGWDVLEEAKRKFRIRAPYFVFCSVAEYHKGLDILVQAIAEYNETHSNPVQLVVIGRQQNSNHAWIREVCFDAGISGREVRVTGYVSQQELQSLYEGALALVSPSRCEGFGLPAAEAMAAGVPVIAANSASLPEVVGDAGILYETEDVQALVAAMERVINEPALRQKMIEKGRSQVTKFAPELIAKQSLELYAQLAKG